MPGGKCPLGSCMEVFITGKAKRRHVFKNGHGDVVHCSSCNEPFLTNRALEQHTEAKGQHSTPPKMLRTRKKMKKYTFVQAGTPNRLYSLSSKSELNSFVANEIEPSTAFLESSSAVVNKMVSFLQTNNSQWELIPRKVIKGGSLGKGTAVKGKSDVDLILVLGGINDLETLKERLPDRLHKLKRYLGMCSGTRVIGTTPHAVKVNVTTNGETHPVDILPALDFDLNYSTSTPLDELYEQIASEKDVKVRELYSTFLAPLQLEIIRNMPTKVKSLIRLVKYWKKKGITSTRVPTSYVMELVVIQAWQRQGSPIDFDIVSALKDVLTQLIHHRKFRVEFGNLRKYPLRFSPSKPGPYIIDPTNPFNDLYLVRNGKLSWDWADVSREAHRWLNTPLFKGVDSRWN